MNKKKIITSLALILILSSCSNKAKTAYNIAKEINLDPDVAFACGALHDIGKMSGAKDAKHFLNGYKILRADSYFFPARIALSHSFQIQNIDSYVGKYNISEMDKKFVENF